MNVGITPIMEDESMTSNLGQLRVDGLTPLQLAELRSAIASADKDSMTTLETPTLGGGKVGEPMILTVVITLTPSVIAAITLWLAKQKTTRTKKLRYEKIHPNGARELLEIDESCYEEGESSSAAIQTFLEKTFT
jgi:hypothetical protein